jgi:hypothetical protein
MPGSQTTAVWAMPSMNQFSQRRRLLVVSFAFIGNAPSCIVIVDGTMRGPADGGLRVR